MPRSQWAALKWFDAEGGVNRLVRSEVRAAPCHQAGNLRGEWHGESSLLQALAGKSQCG